MKERTLRLLIDRIGVPPRWLAYARVPSVGLEEYCRETHQPFREIREARTVSCPLPRNVASRSALSRDAGRYERSFYDVPELSVGRSVIATVRDCRVLRIRDQWNNDFYSVVTPDDRELKVTGLHYRPEHARLLRTPREIRRLDAVTWVTTHSSRNHYMWLYTHLPRIRQAQLLGQGHQVLLPCRDTLNPVKLDSLARLGVHAPRFFGNSDEVIHVDELTIVDPDPFDAAMLDSLRERMTGDGLAEPTRRLLISREKCNYRRLKNESGLLRHLQPLGFERVFLEDLSLSVQVDLLASAEVVLGLHGAGFANVLFCQPGTHIVEIQDPEDPNPHFYALAALLGLDYWLIHGSVDANERAHFRDVRIELDKLMPFIDELTSKQRQVKAKTHA